VYKRQTPTEVVLNLQIEIRLLQRVIRRPLLDFPLALAVRFHLQISA
jgi:hypothetical protein